MNARAGRARQLFHTRFFLDFPPDHRRSILLTGTGRSGTTWLANIINYRNEYRLIFEPFHPHKVGLCGAFRYRQYLRPENLRPEYIGPARAILSGRVRNRWTDSHNRRFLSSKRVVKDIRANHLLQWIHQNFAGIPIVLLLRHPCAVAHSRLRLGWGTHIDEFLAQEDLMADFLEPYRPVMEEPRPAFEGHVLLWCLETYVPLRQFRPGEIHLVFYESLCQEPQQEIERLFSFLGKEMRASVLDEVGKPSAVSRNDSAVLTGASLIEGWREHVGHAQVDRAIELLHTFGLDGLYAEAAMPDVEAAYEFMDSRTS